MRLNKRLLRFFQLVTNCNRLKSISRPTKKAVGFKAMRVIVALALFFASLGLGAGIVYAVDFPMMDFPDIPLPQIGFDFSPQTGIDIGIGVTDDPETLAPTLMLLFLISIITLAPTLILMLTGFTRIIVVLHFLRSAMGTQQMPPNQVLLGLALFLTLFMMGPFLVEINDTAFTPYMAGEITQQQAIDYGIRPIRRFMMAQVNVDDLALFMELAAIPPVENLDDIPMRVLIPAFLLNELTQGFIIGFFLYLPFIVIDMVVASVLMAMGMMMLPPAMISLPFKILLFILGGGWSLVIRYVMMTFQGVP